MFTIAFGFFHYWLHLFNSPTIGFFITDSSDVFISPLILLLLFVCFHFTNFFYRDCFLSGTSFLSCFAASATDLESFLYSQTFLPTPLPTSGTTCFYQDFPGASSSALKVAGPLTEVWNTDPTHLFVWVTLCSAKSISR